MKPARWLLAFVFLAPCFQSTTYGQSARDAEELTVRLYSTHAVSDLHLVTTNATLRTCTACVEKPAPSQMDVSWNRASTRLLVDGKPVRQLLLSGQIRVADDDGKVEVAAGKWKVVALADGLHLLLTVPSERYVMAVLAGEAAPDEPMESLKALAVVARSFALMNPHRHGDEGLCDSTHCQALRMMAVPDSIAKAVQETAGETLWLRSRQVEGYFTQNCGGQTADAAAVWGGERKPWLVSHADPYCQRRPSQWHASMDVAQLRGALDAEGWKLPEPLRSVRIVSKDNSGRASKIEFANGDEKLVVGASSLRFVIDRRLGWNQLRSDWYAVHLQGVGSSSGIVFDGKGYGHGVGLCQAGANEMAKEGKSYRDILRFYFPGTSIRIAGGDDGWGIVEGSGWTLRSKTAVSGVKTAGDAAWVTARARWPIEDGRVVHPTVVLAPDTELFRQMTNEPGWALASTRGGEIVLQPLEVLQKHGRINDLLLHEFLHCLVEAEAGASAPLWLREGLVEVLAGERGSAKSMTAAQIELELQHADSLRKAQQAHAAARELVRKLIDARGVGVVRGWLRGGVPVDVR